MHNIFRGGWPTLVKLGPWCHVLRSLFRTIKYLEILLHLGRAKLLNIYYMFTTFWTLCKAIYITRSNLMLISLLWGNVIFFWFIDEKRAQEVNWMPQVLQKTSTMQIPPFECRTLGKFTPFSLKTEWSGANTEIISPLNN